MALLASLIAPPICGVCASGCGKPTEIVVRLEVNGTLPPVILVKLHRSTPFGGDPGMTPSFVTAALDGADLDLYVTPSGAATALSLLPAKNAPSDLRITVSAPGYQVMPADPRDVIFTTGVSQELVFTLNAPVPDGGQTDGARDGGSGNKDGGAKDGGAGDGAAVKDLAGGGG